MIVGWCPMENRVMDAVGDFLESCAQVIVDIEVVESLLRPENLEVSLTYVLKHALEEAALFSSSSIHQKGRTTLCQPEEDCWIVREETVHGKRMGKTSGMTLSIKALGQKSRRAPTEPQQSLSSAREEEDHWVLIEDRRRRRVAFENLAEEMLRYLDGNGNGFSRRSRGYDQAD